MRVEFIDDGAPRARLPQRWLFVLAAAALFYGVFIGRSAFWVGEELTFSLFDDAMVSMRYAQNLARGAGLVWNPGEVPIEGYTNPLWTLWMSIVHLLPLPVGLFSLVIMISGAFLLLLNAWLAGRIARVLEPDAVPAQWIAVALTASFFPLVFWSLRGMEVAFLSVFILAAVDIGLRLPRSFDAKALRRLALYVALALLTRPDAMVPIAVLGLWLLSSVDRAHRKTLVLYLGLTGLFVVGGHTVFRWMYYGDIVPNTAHLKLEGVSLVERISVGGQAYIKLFCQGHLYPVFLVALLGVRGVRDGRVLLLALFLVQSAYSVFVGGDAWEFMGYANRYICVGMAPLLICAALGLSSVARDGLSARDLSCSGAVLLVVGLGQLMVPDLEVARYQNYGLGQMVLGLSHTVAGLALLWAGRNGRSLSLRWLTRRAWAAPCLAALVWIPTSGLDTYAWVQENALHVYDDQNAARTGIFLRENTAPDATIAVDWAGAIPYFSKRPAVDLLGKNDAKIAKMKPVAPFRPGHNKWDLEYGLNQRKPDYVVVLFLDPGEVERRGYRLGPPCTSAQIWRR